MNRFSGVEEGIPYGVYIWKIDGKPVVNEDYDYLQVASRRGDQTKIDALRKFVQNELGIYEGEAHFLEGQRPISQSEYEEQRARQAAGLVPDQYDIGNLIDEYKFQKELEK